MGKKKVKKLLGAQIGEVREQLRGISQQLLADLIDSSQSEISRWQKQADRAIPQRFAERIYRLLYRHRLGLPLLPKSEELIEFFPPKHAPGRLPRVFIALPASFSPPRTGRRGRTPVDSPPHDGSPPNLAPSVPANGDTRTGLLRAFRSIAAAGCVTASLVLGSCLTARVTSSEPGQTEVTARDDQGADEHDLARPDPDEEHLISDEQEQTPYRVPGEVYTTGAMEGTGANEAGTKPKRSIPIPKKPYSWQKIAPCDTEHEVEKDGGCWLTTKGRPPCPRYSVESDGKCLMPIPAEPKSPSTVHPKQ